MEGGTAAAVAGDGGGLTCVICWGSSRDPGRAFPDDDPVYTKRVEGVLAAFRDRILKPAWEGVGFRGGGAPPVPEPGSHLLELSKHFSACLECLVLLNKAMDSREEVIKVEARARALQWKEVMLNLNPDPEKEIDLDMGLVGSEVKELQRGILYELLELKRRLTWFSIDMRVIAEVVMNVGVKESQVVEVEGEAAVRQLRGEILKVAMDLEPIYKLPCFPLRFLITGADGDHPGSSEDEDSSDDEEAEDEDYDLEAQKLSPATSVTKPMKPSISITPNAKGTGSGPLNSDEDLARGELKGGGEVPKSDIGNRKHFQAQTQGPQKMRMGNQFGQPRKEVAEVGKTEIGCLPSPPTLMPMPTSPSSNTRFGAKPRVNVNRKYVRKLFKCSICNYVFRNATARVTKHMEIHNPHGKKFKCSKCPNSYFKNRLGLVCHDNVIHKKMKPNVEDLWRIRQHVEVIRSTKEKCKLLYKCKICGKILTQRGSLNSHIRAFHVSTDLKKLRPASSTIRPDDVSMIFIPQGNETREVTGEEMAPNWDWGNDKREHQHNQVQIQKKGTKKMGTGTLRSKAPGNEGAKGLTSSSPVVASTSSSSSRIGGKSRPIRKTLNRPLKCSICDYAVRSKNFARHMEIHNPQGKPFKCLKCNYCCYFKTRRGLLLHDTVIHRKMNRSPERERLMGLYVEVVASNSEKYKRLYKCKLCGKTCTQRCHVNAHIRSFHHMSFGKG